MTNRRFAPAFSGNDQASLTRRLQAIDFAIQDTVLYLDAYPDDADALDYYRSLIEARAGLLAARSKEMPLTVYDNTGTDWDWVKAPWPWQPEAN